MTFPIVYCGNIEYYALWKRGSGHILDQHEHFIKQTYRTRCRILGPNGVQDLIVPVHWKNHMPMSDVKTDTSRKWYLEHWRSLEAAYRSAPYFEDYAPEIETVLMSPPTHLVDLNLQLHTLICGYLKTGAGNLSTSFIPYADKDPRLSITPKKPVGQSQKAYPQVFPSHGFVGDLSVLDLLFNEGPMAGIYLQNHPVDLIF